MEIAVAGLGLIGGSIARTLAGRTPHKVYGWNRSESVVREALEAGAIHGALSGEVLARCEAVFIGLYPSAAVEWLRANACSIRRGAVVMDVCGVKSPVCGPCGEIADAGGFTFIGAHPMAGVEHSGFASSKEGMFDGASMILTPRAGTSREAVERARAIAGELGFARIVETTPEEHDLMIAYTSQLPHVVSSAFVMSECSRRHAGFSAGSYRDMTRVACLNEDMWTELFMDNSGPLADELGGLIERLEKFRAAISARDAGSVREMLRAGRERKEEVDGIRLR